MATREAVSPIADRSVSISLRLKVAEFIAGEQKAKGALTDLDRKLAETSGFAKGFRAKLEATFKNLPKIELDANSKPADLKLAEVRAKLEALSAKTINVDIDAGQALAEMVALHAELETLHEGASFEVRADIEKAISQLHAVEQEVQRIAIPAGKSGEDAGGAFARAFRTRLEAGFTALPKATIDANSSPAEAKLAELRARLQALSSKTIGVDVDAASALAQMRAVETELRRIANGNATVDVRADAARALAELGAVNAEVSSLDGRTANVRVDADVSGALRGIAMVGAALAGLASIPAIASIGAGALGLGAAFGAAGAGVAGFAAVAIPSLGRVNEALKQQQSAAGGAGGAAKSLGQSQADAASRALQLAQAQDRVKDALQKVKDAQRDVTRAQRDLGTAQQDVARAIEDAASRHADALRRIADAERQVGDAQRDALRAQQDLNDARKEAARDLEDLGNRLTDTQLDQRQAVLDLQDAQDQLNATMRDPRATQAQKDRAQLNYDRAVQRVKELELALQRLNAEQKQADKDGVEGSKKVADAKDALADANRRVADAQQAVVDAQRDAAKVDEDNARRIADAQQQVIDAHEKVADAQRKVADAQRDAIRAAQALKVQQLQANAAMQQAGGAAGGAATKMSELSKREQQMAKDIKGFQDAYKTWQQSLEGDVFPAITGGLDLVQSMLPRISPLVKSAGGAFVALEKDARKALEAPFWTTFLFNLNTEIPTAIDGLGNSMINVGTGFAGILNAFLPFTPTLVGGIEEVTRRFSEWGQHLRDSPEFKAFVQYAIDNAPKVAELIGNIGEAIGHIIEAGAGPGSNALNFLVGLSEKLANLSPDQIQAIASGVAALFGAAKLGDSLKIAAIVGLADVLGKMSPEQIQAVALAVAGVVVAAKGFQAVSSAITMWSTFKGKLADVGEAASGASGKLASIGKAAGIAGGVLVAAGALHELARDASGANISVDGLSSAFERLQKTGRITGDLATAYGKDLKGAGLLVEGFGDGLRRNFDPTILDNFKTGFGQTVSTISGGIVNIDPFLEKLKEVDQTLANMVDSGNVAGAQEGFRRLAKEAKDAGIPIEVLKAQLPEYTDALGSAATRTDTAADAMKGMAGGSEAARKAIDDYSTALSTFAQKTDAAAALAGLKKAYDDTKKAVDDSTYGLDLNAKMNDKQREAVIKARDQFSGYLTKVSDAAKLQADLANKTGDAAVAQDKQKLAILQAAPKMFELAGKSKEARDAVYKLGEAAGISKTDMDHARDAAKQLADKIAALKSKSITISVKTEYQDDLSREALRQANKKADGGIVRFAQGGIARYAAGSENHLAEIAPAGSMRVWAEPETGGEAYIPLAASKRARSEQILAAVAGEFDMQLMPKKLALIAMANGGLVAGGSTPVFATGGNTGGLTVSIDNLGGLTTSLDATSKSLNEKLAGAGGLLVSTLGGAGTLTKQVEAVGKVADVVGKTAEKVATTTASSTTSLTKAIASLTTAINKLTTAVSKAGSAAKTSTSGAKSTPAPKATPTAKKPTVGRPTAQSQLTENDAQAVKKKPTNQIDGSTGGGSDSIVGPAAYAGASAAVRDVASQIGQAAGAAFGSVMAGSASRYLPINRREPDGTTTLTQSLPATRKSAPQMGNPNYYNGVYSQAAQSGGLAGRLAHEAAGLPPQKQTPALHIENYHPPQNASPRYIAEEISFLARRG